MSDVVTSNPLGSSGVKPESMSIEINPTDSPRTSNNKQRMCTFVGFAIALVLALVIGAGMFFVGRETAPGPDKPHSEEPHWSYFGEGAPRYWTSIGYPKCALQSQSPINIVTADATSGGLVALQYNYSIPLSNASKVARKAGHPGFAIEPVPGEPADHGLTVDGVTYRLKQFHFHTPSEHTINGMAYPLEMHMVHEDANKNLAVLGMMFGGNTNVNNTFLDAFWGVMTNAGTPVPNIDLNDMLNAMQSPYYRYDGSLTTPPCSEGVKWFVSTTTQQVSEAQVQQFILSFRRNARPVQNKNGRTVWSYTF